jgi:hypothetical protein
MYSRLTLHCTWGYTVQYTVPGGAIHSTLYLGLPPSKEWILYLCLTLHCTWGYNVEYTVPGVAPLHKVKNVSTLDPTLYLGVQCT